jgi:hypothetical protein
MSERPAPDTARREARKMAISDDRYRILAAAYFKCRYCTEVYLPLVGSYTLTAHYLEEHENTDAALAITEFYGLANDDNSGRENAASG